MYCGLVGGVVGARVGSLDGGPEGDEVGTHVGGSVGSPDGPLCVFWASHSVWHVKHDISIYPTASPITMCIDDPPPS